MVNSQQFGRGYSKKADVMGSPDLRKVFDERAAIFPKQISVPTVSKVNSCKSEAAILGAVPEFKRILHVGRPNMPDRAAFLRRMNQVLDSGWLSNFGPMEQEFEKRVAEIAGAEHCVATCNATTGLEVAIAGLGMSGDVIVPSFTFIATVHALWRQGLRPVFCDVDPTTHCLDVACVEAAITSRTTGILGVHLWGNSCASLALSELADRHGLKLLFDAAHSIGCQSEGGGYDGLGDAAVFSFHATKCVHAFEGGAIVTNDDALADKLRLMVNFGFSGEDSVAHLGTNGKMSEASAAMGLTSLESMGRFFEHNKRNYIAYSAGLGDIPGVKLMRRHTNQQHNFQYVVTEIDPDVAGLTRDEIVAALRLENICARRYFYPGCHRMAPYAGLSPRAGQTLPVTEMLADRVMALPTGTAISTGDIQRICHRIAAIIRSSDEVRVALSSCNDPRLPDFVYRHSEVAQGH